MAVTPTGSSLPTALQAQLTGSERPAQPAPATGAPRAPSPVTPPDDGTGRTGADRDSGASRALARRPLSVEVSSEEELEAAARSVSNLNLREAPFERTSSQTAPDIPLGQIVNILV